MALFDTIRSMENDSFDYSIASMELMNTFEVMIRHLEKIEDIRTKGMLVEMNTLMSRVIELREEWDAFIVTLRREALEAIRQLDFVEPDETSTYD